MVLVALGAVFIDFGNSRNDSGPKGKAEVNIMPGMSTSEIADLLKEKNIINSVTLFKIKVYFSDVGSKLRAGSYLIETNISEQQAIDIITAGPQEKFYKVPIPEGFLLKQISERVGARTPLDQNLFFQLATTGTPSFKKNYEFLIENPSQSLEGYLFPRTYLVKDSTSEEELIESMLEQFQVQTAGLPWENTKKLKVTPHQIIIIASLIEKEAKIDEERPKVAAVIYNRLRKGMYLQICATVQYSLPKWKDKLTNEDLKVNSPYNTYIHKGLPPGPISNPGLTSIEAALKPTNDNFLYYVLTREGKHFFTANYQEFLKEKQKNRN